MRILLPAILAMVFPLVLGAQTQQTQAYATIPYNPEKKGIFKHLDQMQVVYVANFWNTRRGTNLALRENVLRPDSSRLMYAPLEKMEGIWEAHLAIPPNAAVLSYYITDGEVRDDNEGKTFTAYVYTEAGIPVPNAHYFMVPFLELAGEGLDEQLREAEQELLEYPSNFRAYTQYFTLYTTLERGSVRAQKRIIQRLKDLELQYGEQPDCLNLIARTYYYILRDEKTALEYKDKISQRDRWQEVEAIFDTRSYEEQQRQRKQKLEQARSALINRDAPTVNFILDNDNTRISVEDLRGKPVVLVFWASTSELSKGLFKPLANMQKKFADKGLTVLAVCTGQDMETMQAFTKEYAYPFTWALNNGRAIQLYGVTGLPATYIINREGVIKDALLGYSPANIPDLEKSIQSVL